MAITPRDNETFYREVDEELRRDQFKDAWQRYGKAGLALALLLLAGLAVWFWWQHRAQQEASKQGVELGSAFEALAANDKKAATAKLDVLARSETPGYRVAALLTKADLAVEANDVPGAITIFRTILGDGELSLPYRDLANVRMTALEFDTLPPAAVISRLAPLAVAGNPWFGSAGEMVAIAHLKQDRPREAARIFAAMAADRKVPDSIRSRAVQMAGSLGVDAIQDAAGATGDKAR